MTAIRTYSVVPSDFTEIIELGRCMHEESVYRHFDFSPPNVLCCCIPASLTRRRTLPGSL